MGNQCQLGTLHQVAWHGHAWLSAFVQYRLPCAGLEEEFVFVGRLDNLGMSYLSLQALIDSTSRPDALADETAVRAVALFDHEEVGSASAQGTGLPRPFAS